MTSLDAEDLLRQARERSAQLETYAADLSRTYSELRRHLQHLTALHEVSTRIVSALDTDVVVDEVLDSLSDLLSYESAALHLVDLDVALPAEGPHSVTQSEASEPRLRASRGSLASAEAHQRATVPNIADEISKAAPWAIFGVFMIGFVYLMPTGVAGAIRLLTAKRRSA